MSNIVPIAEVRTMAKSVATSGMFGLKNENQAFTLMLIAQAEGIAPISAIQKYSVINGMPSLKSHEIQARFQKSGGVLSWKINTNKKAVCSMKHPSYDGVYDSEFTMEDATRMQLNNKDNWVKMPKQMLMARAVSMGVRAVYPECLNNMYSVEEAQDIESPKEEAEIVEVVINDIEADKKQLAMRLKALQFNNADMKSFFISNNLDENEELLNKIVNNKDELMILVEQFENGE